MINKKIIFTILLIGTISTIGSLIYKESQKPPSPIQEDIMMEEEWKQRQKERETKDYTMDNEEFMGRVKTGDKDKALVLTLPSPNREVNTASVYDNISMVIYDSVTRDNFEKYKDNLKNLGYDDWTIVDEIDGGKEKATTYRSINGSQTVELVFYEYTFDEQGDLEVILIDGSEK